MHNSTILGIESSCDDTAVAIWHRGKILANITTGQEIHQDYGGVVPELASRAHQSHIIPALDKALKTANIAVNEIDAIAVAQGPGLMGSLLVGLNTAKGLAMSLNKPLVGVNHLQAHIAALYIDNPEPAFPLLVLLVSGGHTQLILVRDFMDTQLLGTTLDDAAGEAFDKAAKLLGLPYPGGPHVEKWAQSGNCRAFPFPQASVAGLNMSFSGIKTSLLYFLQKESKHNPDFKSKNLADICASYQQSIIDYLTGKVNKAVNEFSPKTIGLVGGVSANKALREAIKNLAATHNAECLIPSFEYCTDNAAMVCMAGHLMMKNGGISGLDIVPYSKNNSKQ
jgi:N6-L-threonylcarbamoyladenine synthase